MARVRIKRPVRLQSWDEVDQALKEIGEINRDLQKIQADQNTAIDKAKEAAKEAATPLQAQKIALEQDIQAYCDEHPEVFQKTRTKVMTFGSVGLRRCSKVVIKKAEDTLAALEGLQLWRCIRIKKEIDKEALRGLDSDTLAAVGVLIKSGDEFGYEVHQQPLAEAA